MTQDEMIQKADLAIAELVVEREDYQKAYNYYHGIRDKEQFKYIEDNYGIGSPTSVHFTPLIKKHVDALIGDFLETPIIPRITCKDQNTIQAIDRERQTFIIKGVFEQLQKQLYNKILTFLLTQDNNELRDPYIVDKIEQLKEELNNSFVSEYETAAQDVVQYIIQSREVGLKAKLRQMFLDLLVTRHCYYEVKETPDKTGLIIEVDDPTNTFADENPNSPFIKDSNRIVVRRWLTKEEILNRYGREMSKDDRETIKNYMGQDIASSKSKYVRVTSRTCRMGNGIIGNAQIDGRNYRRQDRIDNNLIPVYEVQWIEVDSDYVMQRYSLTRIGEEIYIVEGKDEHVQRSISNPTKCSLTVNGVFFDDRTQEPNSLVQLCMHLQDQYDLLIFYRDNLIANSGTVGDWIDVSMLPSFLGDDVRERLQQWIALKKQGQALIDTSQEGRLSTGQAPINTMFSGYDDTVRVNAIQAIQSAIIQVEETASSITGVFRERLGAIQARDAVTNVQVGTKNSFTITRHWYQQMEITLEEMLSDALNKAKLVYKNGLSGTLILGDKRQKIFTAMPEYFTVSDHDIHVVSVSEIQNEIEQIKHLSIQFAQIGTVDPDAILEIANQHSLSEAKNIIRNALRKKKQENDIIAQLQQQVQQFQQQNQELQKQLEQLQKENQELKKDNDNLELKKYELEHQKVDNEYKIKWFEAQTERMHWARKDSEEKRRTNIEISQLNDGDPYNDEIKNI